MLGELLGGRYRIQKILGSGGFGQTYVAEDLHRPGNPSCVVKHLKPGSTDPGFLVIARKLFATEAEMLEKLGTHDQIPRLLAHFEQDNEFYLVQELIEGQDLSQELPAGKILPEAEVVDLLKDLLGVLASVHAQNVIHRDLKPANVIRRASDRRLVLIDFGAVKQVTSQTVNSDGETILTIAVGSPGYMPIEQISGKPRLASDVYAVGLIGIQALTGLLPQRLPQDMALGEFLWRDRAVVSAELADILDQMVKYDFRQRFASAAEALQALKMLPEVQALDPQSMPTGVTLPSAKTQPIGSVPALAQPPAPKVHIADTVVPIRPHQQSLPKLAAGILASLALLTGGAAFLGWNPLTQQQVKAAWAPPADLNQWAKNLTPTMTMPGSAKVYALIVSPNGQLLISGGDDQLVKVMDPKTGSRQMTLSGHTGSINALAISPDNRILASGSSDKTIKLWDLTQPKQAPRTLKANGEILSLAISPDGRILASGSSDKTIKLWDLQTGAELKTVSGSEDAVSGLVFKADGKTLISASQENTIRFWDAASGEAQAKLVSDYPVDHVLLSSDGKTLISGSADGIRIWSLDEMKLMRTLPQRFSSVASVALSPDGRILVGGIDFRGNTVNVWDAQTGEKMAELPGHTYSVMGVAFSPDGQTLYSGSVDGSIKAWQSKPQL